MRIRTLLCVTTLMSGCGGMIEKLNRVGEQTPLTRIQDPRASENYHPVTMPMPQPIAPERLPNSLWQPGSKGFFRDQRARQVGDILTVKINLNEKATFSNKTSVSRTTSENTAVNSLLGTQKLIKKVIPGDENPSKLLDIKSAPSHVGTGTVNRSETLLLNVAATVIQILPNGNMVINGKQEIRINQEVRDLQISGIVRREDIMADNTVSYEKIAEARISCGGRGNLSDVQEAPYGNQILDAVMPF